MNAIDAALAVARDRMAKDKVTKETNKGHFFDEKPWPKDEDEIDSEKEAIERREQRKAKDAEYIEKPHLGRISPRNKREAMDNEERLKYSSAGAVRKITEQQWQEATEEQRQRWRDRGFQLPSIAKDVSIANVASRAELDSIGLPNTNPSNRAINIAYKNGGLDTVAFDENSVRSTDPDGRLHVATTNISKATVNPYKGSEIPDYEKLGLDPGKLYQLYRDPDELAKAAPTFNNLPLLKEHVPITADTHKPELVIGSTGTDASYEAPYLKNSLVLWSKDGITDVESNKKKELSSAYRYVADMTPGVFEDPETGEKKPYDGVMRNIVGNHVALVKEGRAGHDVVVGDSKAGLVAGRKKKRHVMGTMSKTAANTMLVLSSYLRPKLALDKKINLKPVVKDLTKDNFNERRSGIISEVRKLTKGKLATDANIGEIAEVLDLLEAHPETGEDAPVTDTQEALMSEMTDVPGAPEISGHGSPGGDRRARDKRARDAYDRKARDRKARDVSPMEKEEAEHEVDAEDRYHADDRHARDNDPSAEVESFLKDKLSGSDLQHVCNLMRGGAGEDDNPGGDEPPGGEEHLEELGAAHAEDDPMPAQEIRDIDRSREWHVGANEEPGAGHPGTSVEGRHTDDRRRAYDRRAKDKKRAHDTPPPFKGMPEVGGKMMDKRAMDAAIKASVEAAISNQKQIRQAEKDVRPWVGELAMDSATCPEDIYAAALKARGVNTKDVHPSAFFTILQHLPKPGQGNTSRGSTPRVAMDANSRADFNSRFPDIARNMSRIGNL